uniref:Thiol-activated cytolysin C-terminal domain-containing protein n=1 Tax=Riptortus pedestris TaxID=329032 RepID=R4WJK9_RIPPE|nr:unknown secreted protein [Riptortus pedestris]
MKYSVICLLIAAFTGLNNGEELDSSENSIGGELSGEQETEFIDSNNITALNDYNYGIIKFTHHGAYIAKFYADWNEVSIGENGQTVKQAKSWDKNGRYVTAGFSEEIVVKDGSTDVHVRAIENTGLLWDLWRTVFDLPDVPVIKYREFIIQGTTLSPSYSVQPSL